MPSRAITAFLIFALRKTTPLKRIGFWRESLRPFLISLMLFAVGGTISGIAREWDCCGNYWTAYAGYMEIGAHESEVAIAEARSMARESGAWIAPGVPEPVFPFSEHCKGRCIGDEGRIALVSGLVLSSIALIFLQFFTGGKPRPLKPFLRGLDVEDQPAAPPDSRRQLADHHGTAVLVLGILGLTSLFPCGIIAWVLGNHDLQEMNAGRMDPSGMSQVKAGKVCGMVACYITALAALLGLAWVTLMARV